MSKTDNIPPYWQQTVVDAIISSMERRGEDIASGAAMDELAIAKEIYKELVERMKAFVGNYKLPVEGREEPLEMELPLETLAYAADGLARIVRYAQKYAADNPPTHRKGFGDAFTQQIDAPPDVVFLLGGGKVGDLPDGSGDGFPDPEAPPPEDDGEWDDSMVEYPPDSEVSRAKATLNEQAALLDFGAGDDPLPFVRAVAKALGGNWGLNGKRGDPNNPSGDILAWKMGDMQPLLFDVLRDSGGKNEITWSSLRWPQSAGAVWIEP